MFSIASISQIRVQENEMPRCGSDVLMNTLRLNPAYAENEKNINEQIRKKILLNNQVKQAKKIPRLKGIAQQKVGQKSQNLITYTIPVVFHIVSDNPDAITDQMVIDALKELNDAFGHRGVYGVDTLGANTGVQFCLAKTAPDGGITTGIDRVKSYYENIDADLEGGVLNSLTEWDPSKYANIWVVTSIQGEIPPSPFQCGVWTRTGFGGYASAGGGAVVSGLSTPLVAHEMGHYLSLLHTFAGTNCANNDCTTDGDLVCDTPPDATTRSSPCNNPENSCNTDTLSGPFTKDMPDNISNFMDYGSPCPTVFTQGQADRMRVFAELFSGGGLIASTRCNPPCAAVIEAKFDWYSNPHPIAGDVVLIKNNSTGSTNFEWYIDNVLVSTSTDLLQPFTTIGNYKIKLIAYDATKSCSSTYTGKIIVNCGVDGRFSPNKRMIASELGIYKDPVLFRNTSYGGDTYQWFVSDNTGANETMVSSSTDLLYDFPLPGNYKIRLEASKGACLDKSNTFNMQVLDPAPDGLLSIYAVNCYKNDSIRIVFAVVNTGYDTIPAGTSINFYDKLPGDPSGQKLNATFFTDRDILGNCEVVFTHIIKASSPTQDLVTLVLDEENAVDEKNESNNSASRNNYRFRVSLTPSDTLVYVNNNVQLKLLNYNDPVINVKWITPAQINCVGCVDPILRITDTTLVKVIAESNFFCTDSSNATINVYPIDLGIFKDKIYCYQNDRLLVKSKICLGNNYTGLKKDIEVRYYDADTSLGTAIYLGSGSVAASSTFINGCINFEHIIQMSKTGNVFMYVNRDLVQFENQIINNKASIVYTPFTIRLPQNEIDVFRGDKTQLNIIHGGENYTSLLWTPAGNLSCSDCPNPVLNTNVNLQLKVLGTTLYFCTDSASLKVNTFYQSHLALPNVFTPDNDGLNDIFYVIAGKDVTAVKQFQIFNRWGEKVFEKSNVRPNEYSSGWDGNYKGKKAPMATYVYYITITLQNGTTEVNKGNITLIR